MDIRRETNKILSIGRYVCYICTAILLLCGITLALTSREEKNARNGDHANASLLFPVGDNRYPKQT